MIGNNDWLDYIEYRDYLSHSWKGSTWDKVKYTDKITLPNGRVRYLYPGDAKPGQNNRRRSVPTYMDKAQRESERRSARNSAYSRSLESNRRAETTKRARSIENSRRSMESNALSNRQSTDYNIYNRQQRAKTDAERRAAEQQGMQNRAANNQQIESRKLAQGYANQQRAAEQQMTQNRMASDAATAQRQRRAQADAQRREAEQRGQEMRAQNEQQIAENKKPKNLFDHMGNALNSAAKWAGDRAKEAGDAAKGVWDKATGGDGRLDWEDVTRVADKAGREIGNTVSNVGNAAKNAGDWLHDRANEAYQHVNDAGDWIDENVTGATQRSNAKFNNRMADQYWEQARNADNYADDERLMNRSKAFRDMANQQMEAANNTVLGRLGSAVTDGVNNLYDNAANAGRAVVREAGNIGRNLFDAAGNAVGGVRDFIGDRVDDAGNWIDRNITGNSARETAERRRNEIENITNNDPLWFTDINESGKVEKAARDERRSRDKANRSLWGQIAGDDGRFDLDDVRRHASNIGYDAKRAAEDIGNAAANAGKWIGNRVDDVGNWIDSNITGNSDRGRAEYYDNEADRARHNAARDFDISNSLRQDPEIEGTNWERIANSRHDSGINELHKATEAERKADEARSRSDQSVFGRIGNAASNLYNTASNATESAVNSARSLISAAGGNINQAINLATQRLRYAQNTGNPEMVQQAQAVVNTLENSGSSNTRSIATPAVSFRDRLNTNVSPEYLEELAFNSNPSGRQTYETAPTRSWDDGRRTNASSEYQAEMENNSRRNNLTGNSEIQTWDNVPTATYDNAETGGGHFTYDPQSGETVYVDKNGRIIRR